MSFLPVWKNRFQKFLDNPRAIVPFFKKRFYYNFIADNQLPHYTDFTYLNYADTIATAIRENRSLIRFGDELFDMIEGIGLYFNDWHQSYRPALAARLQEIISSDDPHVLLCFNPEFILMNKKGFRTAGIPEQYHFWTNSKMFLKDYYHPEVTYGSALCFHPRYNTAIDYAALATFFSTRSIIIVTSRTERFKDMQLGASTTFIEAPQSNAWDEYDRIHQEVRGMAEQLSATSAEPLVLISMGTAAKVLAYDLMKEGVVAWDTGQFFDLAASKIREISTS
jgi:hypothetical protein